MPKNVYTLCCVYVDPKNEKEILYNKALDNPLHSEIFSVLADSLEEAIDELPDLCAQKETKYVPLDRAIPYVMIDNQWYNYNDLPKEV